MRLSRRFIVADVGTNGIGGYAWPAQLNVGTIADVAACVNLSPVQTHRDRSCEPNEVFCVGVWGEVEERRGGGEAVPCCLVPPW